jgi:diguanylate cyclase (GGDEF)-like protein
MAVNTVTTDSAGFIWVGTENGAYRFLGSGFEQYGKDQGFFERSVEDIYTDSGGIVWAGTGGNLYRWVGQRFVPAGKSPIRILGARQLAAEDGRHLLVIDNNRLFRLEHDAEGKTLSYGPVFPGPMLAAIPELNHLSSVSVVGGGAVWMGCGRKLCSWVPGHPEAVTQWGTENGVPQSTWHEVVGDREGGLWAVGQQHHVVLLRRGEVRFVDRDFPGPDPNSVYQHAAIIVDRDGRIVVTTEVGVAELEGNRWRLIDPSNGQHIGHITSMTFDVAGDLWLGSYGHGVFRWVGHGDWEGWSDMRGLPSANVQSLVALRADRVLVGTERGPGLVNPQLGSAGSLLPGVKWTYGQVNSLGVNRDGSLWAGIHSGTVLRIDSKTGRIDKLAELPGLIANAEQDSTGRVFFATEVGLYVRDGDSSNAQPHRVPAVDAVLGDFTPVDASCESRDGAMWILGANKLLREQGGQWTVPLIDGFPKLNGQLRYLSCGADGALWLTGQRTGILHLTPNGAGFKASKLQIPAELSTLSPLAILADRRGWVWLGTDLGLAVWNGAEWRYLTQENGLLWNDLNQGKLWEGPDASIWIGTSGGVSHMIHPERAFDFVPVTVELTAERSGKSDFLHQRQITLPWGAPTLVFRVSSPTMRNRSELVMKVKMDGQQADWTESKDGTASFSNFDPGQYTFMARACNPSLNACSEIAEVEVKVLPPWWRTGWFYALCVMLFVLLLAGLDRMRARHLRERSRELEKLVLERTLELEQSKEQLRIQATHDGLTGMLNRMGILRAMAAEMDRCQREAHSLVVALVDLDHFKRLNDEYGHLAGDEALRVFAAAVSAAMRPYDHAGRYGGEEFLLVLSEVPASAACQRLAQLHGVISNLSVHGGEPTITLTCSLGATVFDPAAGAQSEEQLVAIADRALYEAKATGRNRVVFKEGQRRTVSDVAALENTALGI